MMLRLFRNCTPFALRALPDVYKRQDNEEYVYRTADMISLPGKKLRMKK